MVPDLCHPLKSLPGVQFQTSMAQGALFIFICFILSFKIYVYIYIYTHTHILYLYLVALGVCCCVGFTLVAASKGYSLVVVCRLLFAVASLVARASLIAQLVKNPPAMQETPV